MFQIAILLLGSMLVQGPSLDSASPKERQDAIEQMTTPGKRDAIPALAAALKKEPKSDIRATIIAGLARIGGSEVVPVIAASLSTDLDKDVRLQAVDSLQHLYIPTEDTGQIRTIFNKVKSVFTEPDRPLVADGVNVDQATKDALSAAMQKDFSDEVRAAAAHALGSLKAKDQVPVLIATLENPQNREHQSVRLEIAESLGVIRDPSAGPALERTLRDDNTSIVEVAITAIGMVGYKDARPQIESLFMSGKTKEIKRKAIEALALMRDPASVPLFESLLSNPDDYNRQMAAEGLARVEYDASRLTEMFKLEKKANVRYALAFALAASNQNDYINDLANGLDGRQSDQVEVYLYELGKFSGKIDELHRYLRSDNPRVRAGIVRILGNIGNPSSREFIEPLTHDNNTDVIREANTALRKLNAH